MRFSVNSQALLEDAGVGNSGLMDTLSEQWEIR